MSWLMSGDVFALIKRSKATVTKPYTLRVHLIEADRIATPYQNGGVYPYTSTMGVAKNGNRIYDGVEVDDSGMVQAYYIWNHYPNELLTAEKEEINRVEAYGRLSGMPNVLQIMESERPDQYRGVPYLAPVIEPLLQIRRYTESELTAAMVESFFTAFITTEADPSENPFNEVGSDYPEVSDDPNDYEMGPGQINMLRPGESITFGDPKRPASGFTSLKKPSVSRSARLSKFRRTCF